MSKRRGYLFALCLALSSLSVACFADWPTFQADNRHTGYSPQTLGAPFHIRWKWHEAALAPRAQPIIADGLVFLGGLDGRCFALRAQTGRTAWTFQADGPILASAAVAGEKVYFSTAGGSVFALEARTGRPLWRFRALGRGGFWTAPTVAGGLVLLGARDRNFYAIAADTGRLRWKFQAAGWIVTPAAVGAEKVYFGAEDEMAAYCLRIEDGKQVWRKELPGQTFRDSWPVLTPNDQWVIFTTMPRWPFHYNLREADYSVFAFTSESPWEAERKAILDYLERWPTRQTVFALDAKTGAMPRTLPVLWTGGSGGPPTPPVFRPDGTGYIIFRSTGGIQNPPRNETIHVSSQWNSDLGLLDLVHNNIHSLDSSEHLIGFHLISDETSTLSLAGQNLLIASWPEIGGIETGTGHIFTVCIPTDRLDIAGAAVNDALDVPRILAPDAVPPPPFPGSAGGFASAPIADGVVYWVWDQTLVAIEGTVPGEANGTAARHTVGQTGDDWGIQAPVAPPVVAGAKIEGRNQGQENLARYVWEEPVFGKTPPEATPYIQELREQVRRVVEAGHLAPLWYDGGLIDGWGSTVWGNPGEVVWSLSEALPYLDSGLRRRTITYLQQEMTRYPPWQTDQLPALQGVSRTRYAPIFWHYTDSYLVNVAQHRPWMLPRTTEDLAAAPPSARGLSGLPENLYALYLFARNADRWPLLNAHWAEIARIGQSITPRSAGELAGLIAYARIAKRLGHPQEALAAQTRAVAALDRARDWQTFTAQVGGIVHKADHSIRFPGLYNMTPEVGRFLGDFARPEIAQALSPVLSNPLWFLTKEHGGFGENHFLGPDFTWAVYQTRAYVLGAKDLERTLDLPWVELGDLYYIQKLVTLLQSKNSWRMSE
jgi:outer membrane protein assembly factor BamB